MRIHSSNGRRKTMRGKARRAGAALFVLALVLVACDGGGEGIDSDAVAEGGTEETSDGSGDGSTVTVAMNFLDSMDYAPATSEQDNEKYLALMANNLVGVDKETGQYVGELAESWEVSDDGLTWTFTLKPDIAFHNDLGTVTSEDVKYTWGQWAGDDSRHAWRALYAQAVAGDTEENFEIISDLEFALHAEEPVYGLLQLVCSCEPGLAVVSADWYAENGDDHGHPIGTGPWEYVSHSVGEELVLRRFDDYWGEKPGFENLVIREIPDGAARMAQVQSGTIDFALLDGTLIGEAEAAGLGIFGIPNVRNAFIMLGGSYWTVEEELDADSPWIQADNPEQGLAIREAMSLAIDRETILEHALQGFGKLSYAPLSHSPDNPDMMRESWELPEYDPELAIEKLAEGGYPDGFSVQMPLFDDDFDTRAMGEMIVGMWQDIGLDVEILQIDDEGMEEREQAMDTDGIAYVGTISTAPEAVVNLTSYVTRDPSEGSVKPLFHPAIDEAHAKMNASASEEERREANVEMLDVLRDESLALTLMTGEMVFAGNDRLDGWEPIPGLNALSELHTLELAE